MQQEALLLWKSMASSGRRNKKNYQDRNHLSLPTLRCVSKGVSLEIFKPLVVVKL